MARLGRSQSFAPHKAKPIVAPGGPVSIIRPFKARVISQAVQRASTQGGRFSRDRGRSRHVSGAIVSPGLPISVVFAPKAHLFAGWSKSRGDGGLDRPPLPPKPHLISSVIVGQVAVFMPPGAKMKRQAGKRALLGRTPPRPHLVSAATVVAPTPIYMPPWPKVKLQAGRRMFVGRTTPKPHVAQPTLIAPVTVFLAPSSLIVNQGKTRPNTFGRTGHVHTPSLGAGVRAPAGTFLFQALRRPFTNRRGQRPLLIPALGGNPTVRPAITIVQALRRPFAGRTVPKSHLVSGVVPIPPPFIAPSPVIADQGKTRANALGRNGHVHISSAVVSPIPLTYPNIHGVSLNQTIQRGVRRSSPPKAHVAPPNLTAQAVAFLAAAPKVVLQTLARPFADRKIFSAHLAGVVVGPTAVFMPPGARVKRQAGKRALVGRTPPRPHLASAITPTISLFIPPWAKVKLQAGKRALVGRGAPRAHLAAPTLATGPPAVVLPPAIVVGQQAKQRPLIGRRAPRPILLAPASNNPFLPGGAFAKFQAGRRMFIGRVFLRAHVAPAIVATTVPFIAPSPLLVDQGKTRPNTAGRQGHTHVSGAIVSTTPLVFPTTKIVSLSQAGQRGVRRPSPPKPHLVSSVISLAPALRPAIVLIQSIKRPFTGRRGSRPLTVAALGSLQPVPVGILKLQSLRRSPTTRAVPKPHLAPATLTVVVSTFLAAPAKVIGQALQKVRRNTSRAHLAPANLTQTIFPPNPPGTVISPQWKRTQVGRSVPKPHLVSAIIVVPFIAPSPFIMNQGKTRSNLYLRKVTIQHVARPLIALNQPVRPSVIVSQALRRPYVGRTGPSPHSSRPVVPPFFIAKPISVITQAAKRALSRRFAPAPHLTGPQVSHFLPIVNNVKLVGQIKHLVPLRPHIPQAVVSHLVPVPRGLFLFQALKRVLLGRRGPTPHLVSPVAPPLVTVGHESARLVVQPALDLQQQSMRLTVQRVLE